MKKRDEREREREREGVVAGGDHDEEEMGEVAESHGERGGNDKVVPCVMDSWTLNHGV